MDYCVGLAATPDEVPSNVHCSYFTDKGRVGPLPCDGQFRAGHSVRVFRGEAEFYEQFDRSDNQPIYHGCYVRLQNIPGAVGETGFVPQSSECYNIYVKYDGGKIEAEVGGYRVWEYTGKDGPEKRYRGDVGKPVMAKLPLGWAGGYYQVLLFSWSLPFCCLIVLILFQPNVALKTLMAASCIASIKSCGLMHSCLT